jgi:exodeoxyribonuclease VII large subunit
LAHNAFGYKFETTLFPTKVQNDEQGKQTAERFLEIYKRLDEFDVVVLVRGGGSQTDLNMFDAYPLARVIARFPIPVFCGLGHLKDISVADLMAHTSEKTPTRVAEKIIEHNRSFEQSILDLQNNIVIRTQQLLHMQNERLSGISSFISQRSNFTLAQNTASIFDISSRITGGSIRLVHEQKSGLSAIAGRMSSRPLIQIDKDFNELLNLQKAVFAGSEQMLKFKKGLLEHHVTVFRLLSPEKTLARGFALVKKDGKILTSAASLRKGDELEVLLGSDIIQTKVTDKKKKDGSKNDL